FESFRVLGQVFRQELEGHQPAKLDVFGFVHYAHAAAPQLFQDVVVRDGLANHGATVTECSDMLGPVEGRIKHWLYTRAFRSPLWFGSLRLLSQQNYSLDETLP